MLLDLSFWRNGTACRCLETLPVGDLAWKYLRCNVVYQKDFTSFRRKKTTTEKMMERICKRWGVRCPQRPHTQQ